MATQTGTRRLKDWSRLATVAVEFFSRFIKMIFFWLIFPTAPELVGSGFRVTDQKPSVASHDAQTLGFFDERTTFSHHRAWLAGHRHAGDRVGGDANRPGEFVTLTFPFAQNFAVQGMVTGPGEIETRPEEGTQHEPLEAGRVRIKFDAGDVPEQPFAHRAE